MTQVEQRYIFTRTGRSKLVPVFNSATEAAKAYARTQRAKVAKKVWIVRYREVHEVELLPSRGPWQYVLLKGLRTRVNGWHDTKKEAGRALLRELKSRLERAQAEVKICERELAKARRRHG